MGKDKDQPQSPGRDFRRTDAAVATAKEFPAPVKGELRVHIAPAAYDKMKRHAATTDQVELCGVLVGQVGRDEAGFFLSITGAIEGEGAKNLGSQVTFTHDTWTHIHEVKDREFPDDRIVGGTTRTRGSACSCRAWTRLSTRISSASRTRWRSSWRRCARPRAVSRGSTASVRPSGGTGWATRKCRWPRATPKRPAPPPKRTRGRRRSRAATAAGRRRPGRVDPAVAGHGRRPAPGVCRRHPRGAADGGQQGERYRPAGGGDRRSTADWQTSPSTRPDVDGFQGLQAKVKAARRGRGRRQACRRRGPKLAAIEQDLKTMAVTYDKPPAVLRQQLLGTRPQPRDPRPSTVEGMRQDQANRDALVGDLYLIRLADLVGPPGKVDPSQFTPRSRRPSGGSWSRSSRCSRRSRPQSSNGIRA